MSAIEVAADVAAAIDVKTEWSKETGVDDAAKLLVDNAVAFEAMEVEVPQSDDAVDQLILMSGDDKHDIETVIRDLNVRLVGQCVTWMIENGIALPPKPTLKELLEIVAVGK